MTGRDQFGWEVRQEGEVLHITVDGQILNHIESRNKLMEKIVEQYGNGDHELKLVLLPRKQ